MRHPESLVVIVTSLLLLTPAVARAAEEPDAGAVVGDLAPFVEPRMVGGASSERVGVLDATAVGDDLAYLGARGRERVGLRWIDGESRKERRLAEVRMGDFSHVVETLDDGVVFTGRTMRKDVEPWRSDGTRAGTWMLRDIGRGRAPSLCTGSGCTTLPAGSFPSDFVTIADNAYFSASDKRHGRELWRTDGTRAGTRLVKDIRPGRKSSMGALAAVDGELYFSADDGRHGSEIWRSDGTRNGTRMVTDIGPGWSVQWWDAPVAAGDHVYFAARSADEGLELWRTDGTAEGTVLAKDIRPGSGSSRPRDLIAVGDELFFTARDGEHGRELWRTDGTAEGTVLVRDITPGKEGSRLSEFAVLAPLAALLISG